MRYPYSSLPELDNIFIDKSIKNSVVSQNVLNKINHSDFYKHLKIIEIDDYRDFINEIQHQAYGKYDKKTLLLYPEKGKYMHSCPGSDGVVCCRYFVLDFGMNCPYDCQYCYLQTYARYPVLTVAGNVNELLPDLQKKISAYPEIHWRIGTGEYIDSLALENLTGIGQMLIDCFSQIQNATLELKTKSIEIDTLCNLDHRGNTVISWSLNPDFIVDSIEIYCSTLNQRLAAAKKVIAAGYQVAFHFDPIIFYPDWQSDYTNLIHRLFSEIPENKIRWISLGTFRFTPGLKEKLRAKYPNEFITKGEFILAHDKKFRYLAKSRSRIYKYISDQILLHSPQMMIYLCMETQTTWKRVCQQNLIGPSYLDEAFENRRKFLINS